MSDHNFTGSDDSAVKPTADSSLESDVANSAASEAEETTAEPIGSSDVSNEPDHAFETIDVAAESDLGVTDPTSTLPQTSHTPSDEQSDIPEPVSITDEADPASQETDEADLSVQSSIASEELSMSRSSHRRIDSVPPQKYDFSDTDGLSSTLDQLVLQPTIEEDDGDLSTERHGEEQLPHRFRDDEIQLQAPTLRREASRISQLDRSELNFVDITLDASGTLEPDHPLAGSSKSAEQIRTDSFSSHNLPKSPIFGHDESSPSAYDHNTIMPRSDSHQSNFSDSLSVSHDHIAAGGAGAGPSRHRSISIGSNSAAERRSVEGRYRGRHSRPTSRAASPSASPHINGSFQHGNSSRRNSTDSPASLQSQEGPNSATLAAAATGTFVGPAPILVTADEDGNISVVDNVPESPPHFSASSSSKQVETGPDEFTKEHLPEASVSLQTASAVEDATPAKSESQAETTAGAVEPNGSGREASDPAPKKEEQHDASSPKGLGLSDKADQTDAKSRRKSSSAGVESRTRMTTLPAKSKAEEIKHRVDFEKMMMLAKEAEKKKREEEEERKRRRQDEQREALGRWEKEILPSWTRARKDEGLASLWWKGAPPSIRGRVWALAIGNPLMLPRNLLDQIEKKAASSKAGASGSESIIPPSVLDAIDLDVEDTLPSLKLFQQAGGPLHDDLVRICRAFVLVRMDQVAELDAAGDADKAAARHQLASPPTRTAALDGGDSPGSPNKGSDSLPEEHADPYAARGIELYQPGLAVLAAILLINMPAPTAFICLLNLIASKAWLKALYSLLPTQVGSGSDGAASSSTGLGDSGVPMSPRTARRTGAYMLSPKEKAIRGFERVLETLLADQMPKVYANMLSHNVKLYRVVLRDWVSQLFGKHLDVDTVMRLWDVVLLDESDSLIYRTCLALIQTLESRLYVPEKEELESILRGTNRAALGIWRRDKEWSGELLLHVPPSPTAKRRTSRGNSISSSAAAFSPRPAQAELEPVSESSLATTPNPEPDTVDTGVGHHPVSPPPRNSSLGQSLPSLPAPSADQIDQITPRDYIYEQYGIKEHHIFDTLLAQKTWWKQSTLDRLLTRELGD
ncbi:hypothetical protein BCV70DRAFT_200376 [Testicularia cyperi]|uniref:Rab-GAP TBC domain-containing protein n=1 Tax=Testicularia cyperi TaxID=1882483 RepID=A0A317XPD2_9BASI|nr:hypothetical protein BCV70DRAFT_200376 [Testicularia cyperi]